MQSVIIGTSGMMALHRNNGRQITTAMLSNARRVTQDSRRQLFAPENGSGPRVEKTSHVNWELLMIWSFVVFSFAAFFFCLWVISAKCHGDWPL